MIRVLIFVSPKRVALSLCFVVLFLGLAGIVGQFSKYALGYDHLLGFVPLFDLDGEGNVPAWYSASALLFCSILLAMISYSKYRNHDNYVLHWSALSAVFLGMSLDEAVQIHEKMNVLRHVLDAGGFLYYTWVVVGIAFVLILALAYLRFIVHLPTRTRCLFLIAGALFVGGAVGMEMGQGWHDYHQGRDGVTALLTHVEEIFEMLGIVVFIYALMSYVDLSLRIPGIGARDSSSPAQDGSANRAKESSTVPGSG